MLPAAVCIAAGRASSTAYCLAHQLLADHTLRHFWAHPCNIRHTLVADEPVFQQAEARLQKILYYAVQPVDDRLSDHRVQSSQSTPYPWALYACFPIIFWPLSMFFGKRLGAFRFSVVASLLLLAWYGALNLFLAPGSPWIIFIAFPLLWWPLSVHHYGRRRPDIYAVVMSALSIVFFAAVNWIYSPGAIWAFYPAFALSWWPLSVIFYDRRRPDIYAIIMTLISIAFFAAVNFLYSPGVIWAFIPAFALLWWPLSIILHGWSRPDIYAVVMSLLSIAFLAAINLIYSPGVIWAFIPAFVLLWWPLSVIFHGKHRPDLYAVVVSLLSIAFLAAINLIYSPGVIWAFYPAFVLLWCR